MTAIQANRTNQDNDAQAWQNRIKEVNAHFGGQNGTEWVKPVATGTDSVTPAPMSTRPVEVAHFGTMTREEAQTMLSLAYRDYKDIQGHIDTIAYNFGNPGQFLPILDTVSGIIRNLTDALI